MWAEAGPAQAEGDPAWAEAGPAWAAAGPAWALPGPEAGRQPQVRWCHPPGVLPCPGVGTVRSPDACPCLPLHHRLPAQKSPGRLSIDDTFTSPPTTRRGTCSMPASVETWYPCHFNVFGTLWTIVTKLVTSDQWPMEFSINSERARGSICSAQSPPGSTRPLSISFSKQVFQTNGLKDCLTGGGFSP